MLTSRSRQRDFIRQCIFEGNWLNDKTGVKVREERSAKREKQFGNGSEEGFVRFRVVDGRYLDEFLSFIGMDGVLLFQVSEKKIARPSFKQTTPTTILAAIVEQHLGDND